MNKAILMNKLLVGRRPLVIGAIAVLIVASLISGDGTSGNPFERAEQRVNEYLLYGNSYWYQIKDSEIPIINRLGAGFTKFFEDRLMKPIIGCAQPISTTLFGNGEVAGESLGELAGESMGIFVLLLLFYFGFKQLHKRSGRFRKFVEKVK